jgi:hypothetical protein
MSRIYPAFEPEIFRILIDPKYLGETSIIIYGYLRMIIFNPLLYPYLTH